MLVISTLLGFEDLFFNKDDNEESLAISSYVYNYSIFFSTIFNIYIARNESLLSNIWLHIMSNINSLENTEEIQNKIFKKLNLNNENSQNFPLAAKIVDFAHRFLGFEDSKGNKHDPTDFKIDRNSDEFKEIFIMCNKIFELQADVIVDLRNMLAHTEKPFSRMLLPSTEKERKVINKIRDMFQNDKTLRERYNKDYKIIENLYKNSETFGNVAFMKMLTATEEYLQSFFGMIDFLE